MPIETPLDEAWDKKPMLSNLADVNDEIDPSEGPSQCPFVHAFLCFVLTAGREEGTSKVL